MNLYKLEGPLKLGPLLLIGLFIVTKVEALTFDDPEYSPLYAASARQAFADMTLRDRGLFSPQTRSRVGLGPGAVIVVEGAQWAYAADLTPKVAAATAPRGALSAGGTGSRSPLGVTTELTCSYTCAASCSGTSCGASCDATPTCGYTCHVPVPTMCVYNTCDGTSPTCSAAQPTCFGVSCAMPGETCAPCITSSGPSCTGTCSPGGCPTTLTDVRVPQPGQIQMSFSTSSLLKYTLQFCDDCSTNQWSEVTTVTGNGGVMTLGHTNSAARSFYRLFVQNP